jgi:hypothetical protein
VVFAQFGIHDRLIVERNAAATARNITAHERLFRISIACDLIYCVGAVVPFTALYAICATRDTRYYLLRTATGLHNLRKPPIS